MNNITFFEALGLGNIEGIHLRMLSWIFSKHCQALSFSNQLNVLSDLVGIVIDDEMINIQQEMHQIDLLIELQQSVIIFVSQFKSTHQFNDLQQIYLLVEQQFQKKNKYS